MRIDIYRRAEHAGHFSYLAVPEGRLLPEEVVNTDWEPTDRSVDLADNATHLADFAIDNPFGQINAKGYAITSVKALPSKPPRPS
ncbi:MAG: DUF6139 family protein [Pseudomonadota bacterium]|uniref:DUF6139 family protein n=1 Tax=Herminiimonas arsenitoxidans TaxID=1809410 RepID=UPI00097119D0|nr:DUF6139 family protein [Herminiimonas arsenitoxidans]